MKFEKSSLVGFVKAQRKALGLTQIELSQKSGVGLRFIRDLEQGRTGLRLNKIEQVLSLFGATLVPLKKKDIK